MIKNYFITAWRYLRKNRSASLLSIIGLSVGMTAALLIFLWIRNEVSYDSYHPGADRTYRVTSYLPDVKWVWEISPLPLSDGIKQFPEVEKVVVTRNIRDIAVRLGNQYFTEKNGAYVSDDWFDIFHYDFIEGNPMTFFSQPYNILLTSSTAKKYFGNREALGQTLTLDTLTYRVAAIVKDNPSNSSFQYDVLLPLKGFLGNPANYKDDMTWNNFNYRTFVRLKKKTDSAKVSKGISKLMQRGNPEDHTAAGLEPLPHLHFETDLTGTRTDQPASYKTIYIFTVLGVFLLLIACINYVNLTTARASRRAKEVSIRKVIGAGKSSLFWQFIMESLLISLFSIVITVILIRITLPWFRELTGKNFADPLQQAITWKLVAATLLAATVLNGIYPALLLSSFQPLKVLKGLSILRVKDAGLRKGLVVLQFTFSVVLIISTIIIQRQMNYIQNENPGYNRSQLFAVQLPWQLFRGTTADQKEAMTAAMRQELMTQTSIKDVTFASESPVHVTSSNAGSANWEGRDTSFKPTTYRLNADADYNKVLELQLQQGRWFRKGDHADRHNFILNETAVKDFKLHMPVIGQRFIFQGDTGQIIGVVKDFHFASLHSRIADLLILNRTDSRYMMLVKTQPGKTRQAIAAAGKLWAQYIPNKPFEYTFQDEKFDSLYKGDARLATMIWVFSLIAIIISALGLFGLAAFAAEQRTKEIGIRKVLGATVGSLLALLSMDFLRLVLLSILIATPIAGWFMHHWLQDFAYHVPLNTWVFLLAGVIALLIAASTISYQAIKAARSNPVKNLRSE